MKMKKLLSLLLAAAMVLSLLSAGALAAEEETAAHPRADELARLETLMASLAAGYTEESNEWVIQHMANYRRLGFDEPCTSPEAAQAYIDSAIDLLQGEDLTDAAIAKTILSLTALGADAAQLYAADGTHINAVELLNGVEHSPSAWAAPYTLAAYNQGEFEGAEGYETALLEAVLAAQAEDGSWSEWGDSVQTTSNMLMGLYFYAGDEKVEEAIEKAVNYLSSAQAEDGTYDAYGYGPDANTAAMVVLGLAAAGVDPDADERFIKNGVSAFDFLMSYVWEDNTGFGYQNNEKGSEDPSSTAYATQQGFQAVIAAYGVLSTGAAWSVYDFGGGELLSAYQSAAAVAAQKLEITHPDISFPDVAGHPAETAMMALAQRGVFNPQREQMLPDGEMTRAGTAALMVSALGLEPLTDHPFPDVTADAWYAGFAGTAYAYDIVLGKPDGSFDGESVITRQEAAVMLHRAAWLCGLDTEMDETATANMLAQFGDYTTVDDWARYSVAFCYSVGAMDQANLDIRPTEPLPRHELYTMLYNLLEKAGLL